MKNLIAYIYELRKSGSENIATELLAEIIRSPIAEDAFRKYIKRFGVELPSWYKVRTQEGGAESRCIPDLWVRDEYDSPVAIIESKFYARFTEHQRKTYLEEFAKVGLLLFIVPEKRVVPAFEELLRVYGSRVKRDSDGRCQVEIEGKCLAVSSWKDVLSALEIDSALPPAKAYGVERYTAYLSELKGFCDVTSKEVFPELTEEQIKGTGIAGVIHQLRWLTEHIIDSCMKQDILSPMGSARKSKLNELDASYDSSLFFGQNVMLGTIPIWFGLYGSVWEEMKISPLWIEISDNSLRTRQLVDDLRIKNGKNFVIENPCATASFVIPIPMRPERGQVDIVEDAVLFIKGLKEEIGSSMQTGGLG